MLDYIPSPTTVHGVQCALCTVQGHCILDLSQSRVKKASCVLFSQHNRANSHHSPVMGISGMIPETRCKCSSPPLSEPAAALPHHTPPSHTRTTSPLPCHLGRRPTIRPLLLSTTMIVMTSAIHPGARCVVVELRQQSHPPFLSF